MGQYISQCNWRDWPESHKFKIIVTDLLSALLSNGLVNKPQQRDRFYMVRDATVATQRRSKQTHLCGSWSTRNNDKCLRSFLCSWRRGYITRHWWEARQFSGVLGGRQPRGVGSWRTIRSRPVKIS
jgi:hypothetical protein